MVARQDQCSPAAGYTSSFANKFGQAGPSRGLAKCGGIVRCSQGMLEGWQIFFCEGCLDDVRCASGSSSCGWRSRRQRQSVSRKHLYACIVLNAPACNSFCHVADDFGHPVPFILRVLPRAKGHGSQSDKRHSPGAAVADQVRVR